MSKVEIAEIRVCELRKVIDFVKDDVIVTLSDSDVYEVKRKERDEMINKLTDEFTNLGNLITDDLDNFVEGISCDNLKERVSGKVKRIKETMNGRMGELHSFQYCDEAGFSMFIDIQELFNMIQDAGDYWWSVYEISKKVHRLIYLAKEIYMLI